MEDLFNVHDSTISWKQRPAYVNLNESAEGGVIEEKDVDVGHERLPKDNIRWREKMINNQETCITGSSNENDVFVTPREIFSTKKICVETKNAGKQ